MASTTNPDGDVTAYSYDSAGDQTGVYQGQTLAADANLSATFTNLPQSPNQPRTYEIYVQTGPGNAPTLYDGSQDGYTVVEANDTGLPIVLSASNVSATTPLGSGFTSGWYELGTVTLPASDMSGQLTINYAAGGGNPPSAYTLLEQTSATVYNADEDPVSTTDALGNITAATYDQLDQAVQGFQGQAVQVNSATAQFNNLPQAPNLTRTYELYAYSPTAVPIGWSPAFSDGSARFTPLAGGPSPQTPLGSNDGWYDLGAVTLPATDVAATLSITNCPAGMAQAAILEQTSTTAYDPAGSVLSEVDGLDRVTIDGYNSMEEQTSTSQGQILPAGYNAASDAAQFANLPQTPGQGRLLNVYVEASSAPTGTGTYTVAENGTYRPFLAYVGSSAAPLGANWYFLGSVYLAAADASSALTLTDSDPGVEDFCLVQQSLHGDLHAHRPGRHPDGR